MKAGSRGLEITPKASRLRAEEQAASEGGGIFILGITVTVTLRAGTFPFRQSPGSHPWLVLGFSQAQDQGQPPQLTSDWPSHAEHSLA